MTTEAKSAVSLAAAALWEVGKHSEELDSAQDRKHALGKLCDDAAKEYAALQAALGPAKAELAQVQVKLKAQQAVLNDQKLRTDADLDRQIAAGQDTLVELTGAIKRKTQELSAVEESFASLRKRLWLGA